MAWLFSKEKRKERKEIVREAREAGKEVYHQTFREQRIKQAKEHARTRAIRDATPLGKRMVSGLASFGSGVTDVAVALGKLGDKVSVDLPQMEIDPRMYDPFWTPKKRKASTATKKKKG